jgi:putative resolvase
MEELCSIGELALMLGVAVITLRRWHAALALLPVGRTPGGQRRYSLVQVKQVLGLQNSGEPRMTLAYARVSSRPE